MNGLEYCTLVLLLYSLIAQPEVPFRLIPMIRWEKNSYTTNFLEFISYKFCVISLFMNMNLTLFFIFLEIYVFHTLCVIMLSLIATSLSACKVIFVFIYICIQIVYCNIVRVQIQAYKLVNNIKKSYSPCLITKEPMG